MRVTVAAAVLLACRGDAPAPQPSQSSQQSLHDAAAILCGELVPPQGDRALNEWLGARISNDQGRALILRAANEPPWDVANEILALARKAGISDCHPLDGLAGIRARNGIDVPALHDRTGTFEVEHKPILAITATRVVLEGVGPIDPTNRDASRTGAGSVVVAADRTLAWATLQQRLDELRSAGFAIEQLLTTAPAQPRAVEIVPSVAPDVGDEAIVTVSLGATTTVNGEAVTTAALPAALARHPRARVVIVPQPDVTVQQLAEAIAAAGGRSSIMAVPHSPKLSGRPM
jgi:biopolymer transport protein ExbD